MTNLVKQKVRIKNLYKEYKEKKMFARLFLTKNSDPTFSTLLMDNIQLYKGTLKFDKSLSKKIYKNDIILFLLFLNIFPTSQSVDTLGAKRVWSNELKKYYKSLTVYTNIHLNDSSLVLDSITNLERFRFI